MGFKRSLARMKEIEARLRSGMSQNKIPAKAQEEIILSITSFALYGFPESHAASFALIAYASAFLKCHYLAAFTAALLNNQPMGFYSPATIVKDAQRHGLRMLPVDVTCSEWNCTLEAVDKLVAGRQSLVVGPRIMDEGDVHTAAAERRQNAAHGVSRGSDAGNEEAPEGRKNIALRMGLRYIRGLREEAAQALLRERERAPFTSIHDLTRRVPELRKDELTTLAEIGALNSISKSLVIPASERTQGAEESRYSAAATRNSIHRRDALWQVERAVRGSGPLLEQQPEPDSPSPLQPMNHEERLVADFHGTGLTVGPHPMAYRRAWLTAMGIRRASDLRDLPSGKRLRIGGCVIVRQRPGTAKGFVFVSLEDETGVANAIITPDLFHQNRLLLASERFLAIEGILQNQDNVISVKAERVLPLFVTKAETVSHDFH
jgi:error-prone DNA polymerase